MRARRAWRFGVLLLIALALASSCATARPQTLAQRIAYVQASVTAVRTTATGLLQRQRITAADAERIQARADDATAQLRLARQLAGQGRPQDAQGALAIAVQIVTALEAELKAKGGP